MAQHLLDTRREPLAGAPMVALAVRRPAGISPDFAVAARILVPCAVRHSAVEDAYRAVLLAYSALMSLTQPVRSIKKSVRTLPQPLFLLTQAFFPLFQRLRSFRQRLGSATQSFFKREEPLSKLHDGAVSEKNVSVSLLSDGVSGQTAD